MQKVTDILSLLYYNLTIHTTYVTKDLLIMQNLMGFLLQFNSITTKDISENKLSVIRVHMVDIHGPGHI